MNKKNHNRHRRNLIFVRVWGCAITRFLCIVFLLVIICASANNDSSGDSDSDSKDNKNDDYAAADDDAVSQQYNGWYADDPYYPTDDYVLQQMSEEYASNNNAMSNDDLYDDDETSSRAPVSVHDALVKVGLGSVPLMGLASAIFCTAVFLYFLRVDGLMRRYNSEGVPVDGRIVASVPDVHDELKKCKAAAIEESASFADKIQNNDSYSMMTDNDSYSVMTGDYSGSDDRSLMEEGGHPPPSKGGNHPVDDHREGRRPRMSRMDSERMSTVASPKSARVQMPNEEDNKPENISEGRRKFNTTTFRVIVEYDDITYHDVINQESSEVIRKRLLVTGEDIVETNTKYNNASSDLFVKLHVLKDHNMSGHPHGEVKRALRWQRVLSFNLHILLGLAMVVGGAIVANNLSRNFLYTYLGILVLQGPLINCFLNGSFSKILADRYLDNGLRRPTKTKNKKLKKGKHHSALWDDDEKMISALKQGTSFGIV